MALTVTKAGVAKANAMWLKLLADMDIGQRNIDLYKETFKAMTLEDYEILVTRLEQGNFYFPVFVENMDSKVKAGFDKVIEICKKYDIPLFERLVLTDPITGMEFLTTEKALVLLMPSRRQIHHLSKKISLPENDKIVDNLTGQVTGASKGASITFPEFNALLGKGYEAPLAEFIKLRGGDPEAFKAMVSQLEGTGGMAVQPILDMGTETVSVKTLRHLLLGLHLANNA